MLVWGAEPDLTGGLVNMFSNAFSGGEDKSIGLCIYIFDAGRPVVYVVCLSYQHELQRCSVKGNGLIKNKMETEPLRKLTCTVQ